MLGNGGIIYDVYEDSKFANGGRNEKVWYVSRAFMLIGSVLFTGLRIVIPIVVLRFRFGVDEITEVRWERRRHLRMRPA